MTNFFARALSAVLEWLSTEDGEPELDDARRRDLRTFAYEQADLLRDGRLSRQEALAAIATRFPELSARQVNDALARGLFESR